MTAQKLFNYNPTERKVILIDNNIEIIEKREYTPSTDTRDIKEAIPIIGGPLLLAKKRIGKLIDKTLQKTNTNKNEPSVAIEYLVVPYKTASQEVKWLIPSDLQNNEVYISHPMNTQIYYPAKEFHKRTFEDKYKEALSILMALKPKYLTVEFVEGYKQDLSVEAGAKVTKKKFVEAGVDFNLENDKNSSVLFKGSFSKPSFMNLFNKPALPEDLHWYPSESQWKFIADGRLKHGLKEFDLTLNYHKNFGINSDVLAAIKQIVNAGIDFQFTNYKQTTWRIKGEFW